MLKKFSIVVAAQTNGIIGANDKIPWKNKHDVMFFKNLTTKNESILIMGYKTLLSLPEIYFRDENRINYVISRQTENLKGTPRSFYFATFEEALLSALNSEKPVYVVGGNSVYIPALSRPELESIYMSHILTKKEYENAIRFPIKPKFLLRAPKNIIGSDFISNADETGCDVIITNHKIKNHEKFADFLKFAVQDKYYNPWEYQALDLIKRINNVPEYVQSRNALTKNIFGAQIVHDLADGFPVFTTKKSFFKFIFCELMWFIRGQTDSEILKRQGINIWDGNTSKEYLNAKGLDYKQGDIGPGYGFQFRHSGAEYRGCDEDYSGQGYDQLEDCINQLNNDPTSRRIIINLWSAKDTKLMALPPCHVVYNFGVDLYPEPHPETGKKGKLHCHLFQRSWDILLGWNHATAAMLIHLLSVHCGYDPGLLVHSISNVHLYKDHIDRGGVELMLSRKPRTLPNFVVKTRRERIEDYEFQDIEISDYKPHDAIKFNMMA